MFKVVRLFPYEGGIATEQKVLDGIAEVVERPCYSEDDVIANAKDADAVIACYEKITPRVMDALPNLKLAVYKSIGFNNIDLDYATVIGLPVTHIATYCIKEVADYVTLAILNASRRFVHFHDAVIKDKEWRWDLFLDIRRFECETVGLYGFGNIPRLVAERLQPFGCKILAYDPYIDQSLGDKYRVELVSSEDELMARSDYLSIQLNLNPQTSKMFNKERFSKMKDGAVFINSARGGLVDESDLIDALDSGKLNFAILDVLTDEYPNPEIHPLINHKKVITTPHIAFYSREAAEQGKADAARNVRRFFEGDFEHMELVNKVEMKKPDPGQPRQKVI